jgi:2-polyprenyl-3-methyl-5-hydroxy-6-metoxy-1,4-benzoquinol methylase
MPTRKAPQEGITSKLHLVDDSDAAWQKFGQDEPYYGVLTDDKFRKKNLTEESLKEFFASGEKHVSSILTTLQERAIATFENGDALDFGCGVGRIAIPLAHRFKRVTAVDISEAYRSEAMHNCLRQNVGNIRFIATIDPLADEGARFDFVHSSIVFNHISWARGKIMIAEMFELLRPNGAMAIQVMLQAHISRLRRLGSWLREHFLPFNWLVNVARRRPIFEPLIQGNEYPLGELLLLLKDKGAGDFAIQLDKVTEGHTFAFLFCGKKEG